MNWTSHFFALVDCGLSVESSEWIASMLTCFADKHLALDAIHTKLSIHWWEVENDSASR